ncbi:hypothetical protein [Streptomyces wuyuanensis]|uniref:hypothetical protein n=1 Tax=Streptomyces wuyuanensis TaxID=1196353 RepID=UPI00341B46A9
MYADIDHPTDAGDAIWAGTARDTCTTGVLSAPGGTGESWSFPDLQMCQICAPWASLGMDGPPERQQAWQ